MIICLDDVIQTPVDQIKDNGLKPKNDKKQSTSCKTNMDEDNDEDLMIQANMPARAEYLLFSVKE